MTEKFVFIQMRGGMDGLAALMPDDNSVMKRKRPDLIVGGYHDTGEGFAFHPKLRNHYDLFKNGELSFLHATGLPVRNRSHFKSQDLLETGKIDPNARQGWLGEILERLPNDKEAVAFGSTLPLSLKGTLKAFNWSSPLVSDEDENIMRILGRKLYNGDPELGDLLTQFKRMDYLTGGFSRDNRSPDPYKVIGNFLAKKDGPDIGVISLGNWDTHDNQVMHLANLYDDMDKGLSTLKRVLGEAWNDTIVVIVSEFGRSVHQNGTKGSDHGTGGLCMVAGGAVKGGQSLGEWPGLEKADLFERRDLMPVHDVRMIFAQIAEMHFGLSRDFIAKTFPKIPEGYSELNFVRQRKRLFGFV